MQPTIRRAATGDLPAMLDLYSQLNAEDRLPDAGSAAAVWARMLSSEMMSVLVATCGLVGAPNLSRNMRPCALIENVVTERGLRGSGVGKRVIQAAIEQAWAEGCYKVMLLTGRKDEAVLGFYEACGFRRGKTAFEIRRPVAD